MQEGGAALARPKKYTKKTLAEAVDLYFDSITRIVPVTEMVETGERDDKGHKIYEKRPVKNKLGKEAETEEFIVPPTVADLCQFLGIHRSTWADYCDAELHPEFSDTTTRARGRIRGYLERQLLTRKDVKGVIFDLQNNHGYAEKRQIGLDEKTRQTVAASAASMSMDEKLEMLKQIATDYAEGGGSDGTETI